MTRTTAYAVLSRAVAAQRNGSAPEQVARLDAALAVAGEVLLACDHVWRWTGQLPDGLGTQCIKCGAFKAGRDAALVPLLPVKPDGN